MQVDLGSLKDTVPTDRIVALQGGWGLFRKGSFGEILLRLTYKAYVEDEEDEMTVGKLVDIDASDDDEIFDSDESDVAYQQIERDSSSGTETFMDVLAALIVSEEFQGIVASETGNAKPLGSVTSTVSTSRSDGPIVESVTPNSGSGSESFTGIRLFWLFSCVKQCL